MSRLTKREKLLVYGLVMVLLFTGGGVFLYLMADQMSRLNSEISSLEMQIEKLTANRIDISNSEDLKISLVNEIESGMRKFYSKDELDPYRFSRSIDELLASHNLTLEKYQTVDTGDTLLLEYTIQGDAYGLSRFLQRISYSDKYCSIPFLVIDARENDGSIRAVFRIGYETIDKIDS